MDLTKLFKLFKSCIIYFEKARILKLPYKWDRKSDNARGRRSRTELISIRGRWMLLLVYNIIMVFRVKTVMASRIEFRTKIQTALFLVVYTGSIIVKMDFTDYKAIPLFVESAKTMGQVLAKYRAFRKRKIDMLTNFMLWPLIPATYVAFSLAIPIIITLNPCIPPFLGSGFDKNADNPSFVLATPSHGIATVLNNVTMLKRLLHGYLNGNHLANRVNDVVQIYRMLTILEVMLNECVQRRIMLLLTLAGPLVQTFSIYALIAFRLELGVLDLLLFSLLTADAFTLNLLMFQAAAMVNVRSKEIVDMWKYWKPRSGQKKERSVTRCFKSLRPLRIKFGNSYAEGTTFLKVQDHCLTQTVSLLVITKA
ncbi:hypothetical protein Fcan01_11527 [Folsomia candida]|uniref:Uncharacterized protein n=1 Tax=Folsomia candida TaxID=158441 RepID=A0A226EBV5_FOLCA|nr:hypothetical protein Fcan01_11527 [Folsomia candida]